MAFDTESRRPGPSTEEPLVSIGEAALERMPALGLIFEQAAAAFGRSLAQYTDSPAALSFESLEALRAADLPAMFAPTMAVLVFHAYGLEADLLVSLDENLQELALEAMLGSNLAEHGPKRQRTRIEDRLLVFFAEKLLAELATAAASLTTISFERSFLAEETPCAALGPKASVAILAHFHFQTQLGDGALQIVAPRSAFDPFREALSHLPGSDSKARDEQWTEYLYANVVRTEIRVDVRMEAPGYTLQDVAHMRPGDVLRLPVSPTSLIRASSEERTLFWCSLGQKDGHYTVRLEAFPDERQSFIERVLGV